MEFCRNKDRGKRASGTDCFGFYDQWGQLEDVVKYLEGEVVSDAVEAQEIDIRTTTHTNGTIATRSTYENGVRVGVYTEYDEAGNITRWRPLPTRD